MRRDDLHRQTRARRRWTAARTTPYRAARRLAHRSAHLWRLHGPPRLTFRRPSGYSFDIFDTLLTVAVLHPAAISVELGRRVEDRTGLNPERFTSARERSARRLRDSGQPIRVESVYQDLIEQYRLPDLDALTLANEELLLYHLLLRPIEAGVDAVREARRCSRQPIHFVSDMHLPGAFLRDQLARFDLWCPGDVLWISGEADARKYDGRLFQMVAHHYGPLRHTGDDALSDVLAARWVGWRASRATWGRSTRLEQSLSSAPEAQGGSIGSLVAAHTRQQRLLRGSTRLASAPVQVAASVAAPVVLLFTAWVLVQARREGIDRLYFLSRDGQLLHEIAERVEAQVGSGIALKYLYGGRAAWQRAGMGLAGSEDLIRRVAAQEVGRYEGTPLPRLSARMGLPTEYLRQALGEGDTLGRRKDRDLRDAALDYLASAEGCRTVTLANRDQAQLAISYLEQEDLLRDGRWAIVDVGWRGNTIEALDRLLAQRGRHVERAYFAGYLGSRHRTEPYRAFLWDSRDPDLAAPPPGAVSLLEAICSGSHGPVLGYERTVEGRVEPRFAHPTSAAQETWALDEFRAHVHADVDRLVALARTEHLFDDSSSELARQLMEELSLRPSALVAGALGPCPREEDALGMVVRPLARPFRLSDLPTLLQRDATAVERNLAWPQGALALTSPWLQALYRPLVASVRLASGWRSRTGR